MSHTLTDNKQSVPQEVKAFDLCIRISQWMLDVPKAGSDNIKRAINIFRSNRHRLTDPHQINLIDAIIEYMALWICDKPDEGVDS